MSITIGLKFAFESYFQVWRRGIIRSGSVHKHYWVYKSALINSVWEDIGASIHRNAGLDNTSCVVKQAQARLHTTTKLKRNQDQTADSWDVHSNVTDMVRTWLWAGGKAKWFFYKNQLVPVGNWKSPNRVGQTVGMWSDGTVQIYEKNIRGRSKNNYMYTNKQFFYRQYNNDITIMFS